MSEKRRCKNCGAFLEDNDKVCYICGEKAEPQNAPAHTESKRISFEKDEDFVLPTKSHDAGRTPFEDRLPYSDEDMAEPYYKKDDKILKAQKKRNKKAAIIAICCVLAAAIIGGICVLIFGGFGGKEKIDNKIKIYFDKPKAEINLKTKSGKTYNWSDDVEVVYVVNNKEKTLKCTLCDDHPSLWEVSLPVKAKSIYFFETGEKKVRTQLLPSFEEETVYYVSQETFNAQDQLPLGQCMRDGFEGIGINYATTAETSESSSTEETKDTEETTKSTDETTKQTDPEDSRKTVDSGVYTVALPKSWQSGVTPIQSGKCTTYYEDYNYSMYNTGKLVSIYVFDADDSAADDLTGVKDIRYSSDQKKKIVITTPTDIQFNETDEEAQKNYLEKNKDLNSFLDSITVK